MRVFNAESRPGEVNRDGIPASRCTGTMPGTQWTLRGRRGYRAAFLLAVAFCAAAPGAIFAQGTQGPIAPPPKVDVRHVPAAPAPSPPVVPEDEIIRLFTANEDTIQKAYNTYDFLQTIRVQEEGGGEFKVTGTQHSTADGGRSLRVTKAPESTLKQTVFAFEDVRMIEGIPLFFLTSAELPHYDLKYEGQDALDQVTTYVFSVKPKQLERAHAYFEGAIWVDDRDFAIVKSSGQFVRDVTSNDPHFPFVMFDIYSENIARKLWFPTYLSSDAYIPQPKAPPLHLRLVVRSTEFQPEAPAGVTK